VPLIGTWLTLTTPLSSTSSSTAFAFEKFGVIVKVVEKLSSDSTSESNRVLGVVWIGAGHSSLDSEPSANCRVAGDVSVPPLDLAMRRRQQMDAAYMSLELQLRICGM
jgi:hypothetical protein